MKNLRSFFSRKTDNKTSDEQIPLRANGEKIDLSSQHVMKGVNSYWKELSQSEIAEGVHRASVGGMWEEIGNLQYQFLLQQGLLPEHTLLDVGCGSLRGGVHFVRYLNTGNYFGLDINASLIEAGKAELAALNCLDKQPHLLVNDKFEFSKFGVQVDYALAISVFTHLFLNHIGRCLVEIKKVLKPEGVFFATFFQAPHSIYLSGFEHQPGNVITSYDSDPFHYSFEELDTLAHNAGLTVESVNQWEHPRGQKMLCFRNNRVG